MARRRTPACGGHRVRRGAASSGTLRHRHLRSRGDGRVVALPGAGAADRDQPHGRRRRRRGHILARPGRLAREGNVARERPEQAVRAPRHQVDLPVVPRTRRHRDQAARARVVRHQRLQHRQPRGRSIAHPRRGEVHREHRRRADQRARHRPEARRRRRFQSRGRHRAHRVAAIPEATRRHPRAVDVPAPERRVPGGDELAPAVDAAVPGARQGRQGAPDGVLLRHARQAEQVGLQEPVGLPLPRTGARQVPGGDAGHVRVPGRRLRRQVR
mmetsp:Transcript_8623/g.38046  ORF Transcript_8623/g.38046 Transcript_8623/m.38046 type:complete len:271 (-) Transcript_8623:317-1129(-)